MTTLRTEHIRKDYPGCRALDDISVEFDSGKVHALLGKNGSGKSTLVKVLAGAIKQTKGKFFLDDDELNFSSPLESSKYGIATVYQEMSLIPSLSVAENIFLGRLPKKNGTVDWKKTNSDAKKLLSNMGVDINPERKVLGLSMWQSQVVEITKAMSISPKVLMLDEPTSSLATSEVDKLFRVVKKLRDQDVIIIYISHKLHELPAIADTVTVLRDGEFVGKKDFVDTNTQEILHMMFGDVAIRKRPEEIQPTDEVIMRVENFGNGEHFENINFSLKKGEVLGIAGMLGSGRTELLRAIYGADKHTSGDIYIDGSEKKISKRLSPIVMKKYGLGLTPEDRKHDGLVLSQSVLDNLSFASIQKNSNGFIINDKLRLKAAKKQVEDLQIKIPSLDTFMSALSGGNQQKVIIGNWLSNDPKIMIYDEPTRGIDVNAKQQVFEIMWEGSKNGIATIFVSSELEELLETCNRILIMRHGTIIGEVDPDETKIEELYTYCMEGITNVN